MEFRNIEQRVKQVMSIHPETRNSNDELVIKVFETYGLFLNPVQISKLKVAPSFETITRVRRKIQAGGVLPASRAIQKKRRLQERVFIDYSKVQYDGNTAILPKPSDTATDVSSY